MYIPPKPSGYQSFKGATGPKGTPGVQGPPGSGGTLGSVMSQANKLKAVREDLDRTQFVYGVKEAECVECPGCSLKTCYYIGGGPADVECANHKCKYYKKPTTEKRYYFEWEKPYKEEADAGDDEDTKEIDLDFDLGVDWGIGNP